MSRINCVATSSSALLLRGRGTNAGDRESVFRHRRRMAGNNRFTATGVEAARGNLAFDISHAHAGITDLHLDY